MFERINIFGSGFGFDIMQEVELDRAESKLTAVPYNAKSKLTSVPDNALSKLTALSESAESRLTSVLDCT